MAEEVFVGQSYEVEGEDGTRLKINVAPQGNLNKVQKNLSGRMGTGQDATGFYEQKEKKVKMYQGATPSWIPVGQFQRMLGRGFTPQPTATARPRPFQCDTIKNDGTECGKFFVSRLDRLRHIKNAHADAAMFVLTDDEQALLAGDLTAARRIVPENERGGNKEVDIDALIQERAVELAERMFDELKSTPPFMKKEEVEVVEEVPFVSLDPTVHTCNAKGRFGRVDPNCPACQEKARLKMEEENGTS